MKPTLLILAAGKATRYGELKQVDRFGPSGETIMEYSIYDAIRAGFGKVVIVIRKSIEDQFKEHVVKKAMDKIDVQFCFQEMDSLPEGYSVPGNREKPWGTGHAVVVAKDLVTEPFAIINADDFYGKSAYQLMYDQLSLNSHDAYSLMGYRLSNTLSASGTVSRGICYLDAEGYLKSINECHKIAATNQGITGILNENQINLTGNEVVSMNMIGLMPEVFLDFEIQFHSFLQNHHTHPTNEFELPSVLQNLMDSGKIKIKVLDCPVKWFGVTYKNEKPEVINKIHQLVQEGNYPENLWI